MAKDGRRVGEGVRSCDVFLQGNRKIHQEARIENAGDRFPCRQVASPLLLSSMQGEIKSAPRLNTCIQVRRPRKTGGGVELSRSRVGRSDRKGMEKNSLSTKSSLYCFRRKNLCLNKTAERKEKYTGCGGRRRRPSVPHAVPSSVRRVEGGGGGRSQCCLVSCCFACCCFFSSSHFCCHVLSGT